jgi:hypothetical protein
MSEIVKINRAEIDRSLDMGTPGPERQRARYPKWMKKRLTLLASGHAPAPGCSRALHHRVAGCLRQPRYLPQGVDRLDRLSIAFVSPGQPTPHLADQHVNAHCGVEAPVDEDGCDEAADPPIPPTEQGHPVGLYEMRIEMQKDTEASQYDEAPG